MPYPEMLVAPMRAELTNQGFTELKSADEVVAFMEGNNAPINPPKLQPFLQVKTWMP